MSQINKVLLTTLRKLVSLPDVKQKLRRVLSAASECLSKVAPKAKFPADRIVCGGRGGEYSWEFEVEECLIPDQKHVIFYTCFQTWRRQKLFMELKRHFLKYTHSLPYSLENRTRIQTKIDKVNTLFQTKTEQKPYHFVRHIPIWKI